jgi:protoheme ferro-lyase
MPWLGPTTEMSVRELVKRGQDQLLLVPIAFVSDHIETLFEIDIEYKEMAEKLGARGFKRAKSLNDDPLFIEALANVTLDHLKGGRQVSIQNSLRCPGCTNASCLETKKFFGGHDIVT